MAKSTQRKGQIAHTSKTAAGRKNNQDIGVEPSTKTKIKNTNFTANRNLRNIDEVKKSLSDPETTAAAAGLYSQRQSIDSMCRLIENETNRSMEDKIKELEKVYNLENAIKREAYIQAMEGTLFSTGMIFAIVLGLGFLNRKGIIILPPISIL